MTQNTALTIMKLGHSVFLTGGAGTGKTFVLNEYISWCKRHRIPLAITASTGIAATHVGGATLHSWSGTGIKESLTDMDLDAISQKKNLYDRYTKTQVLIIDEISMLHAYRLDMVDKIARMFRGNSKPFGGMQIIMCGDFFQLPPISKNQNNARDFAFYSESWKKINPVVCYLTRNYRQQEDSLSSILNSIRSNEVEDGIYDTFQDLLENPSSDFYDHPHTKLYTHNEDVDRINASEYKKLKGKEVVYEMATRGKKQLVDAIKMNCLAHEVLRLRPGTQVMFIKNDLGKKYYNGTLGEVTGFESDNSPIVKTLSGDIINVQPDSWHIEDDGKILAEIKQLPLRYSWAITVHKSQGMTLDRAEMDLSKSFGFGMGYVALSRVRSISGLRLLGMSGSALAMHPDIIEFDKKLKERSERAVEALQKYENDELVQKQNNFILSAGGSVEEIKPEELKQVEEKDKTPTAEITRNLLLQNKTLAEVATERGLTLGTIITHLESIKKLDKNFDFSKLNIIDKTLNKTKVSKIKKALKSNNNMLSPTLSELEKNGIKTNYEEIRLARLL